jgi:uncharacterized protein with von Willebrand factor type A (vWA) domain
MADVAMTELTITDSGGFVDLLVDFGRAVRDEGIAVGSGDLLTYCDAAALLDPADIVDLYWAGRTTLVTRHDQIRVYDRVFRRYFLDERAQRSDERRQLIARTAGADSVLQVPETEPTQPGGDDQEVSMGLVGSTAEVWRNKAFAACTPEELAAVRRIIARIRITPPRRRTRRTSPAAKGPRFDQRRAVRDMMRTHGEPGSLPWRERNRRIRPLVLILDVSGSMSDHSRNLLQFAYSTTRAADRVEVFCFGTRLTRITRVLARRRPDDAMNDAAASVFDWDGGTRIGASLDQFARQWGRRGMSRGAIVVICSDGLDRGDPALLASAMERLSRLCHRIVWMNPHMGDAADFVPSTLGMMVAAPFVDTFVSGHTLRSLEAFAEMLPGLR